ncbi:MAG TPA: hypothetical protein VFE32_06785 [Puia sp.]|nr:hypothetical protein [Puia sp.]
MKRLAAILLMGVLFFNWYGYQLLSNYWQNCAERRLEVSFDQNKYDESALISFKVPLTSLSYYNSAPGYERVNGQIDIGGVRYQYVKRRIFGDSLEVLCLPNMASIKLRTASNDFFRQVNDLQQQNQSKKNSTHSVKDNSKDYRPAPTGIVVPDALAKVVVRVTSLYAPSHLPSVYAPIAENPPERL